MAGLDKPLVLVVWHDAHTLDNDHWYDESELKDSPCVVHSVGYRISRPNARHLCLAQSITDEQGSDNVLFIPARMIRKVIKLQIPHKRRKMR